MKICIVLILATFVVIGLTKILGCKTRPNVDNVNRLFYYGGAGTALVMNSTSLSTEKRIVIRDVFVDIKACNPQVGQPLEAAWTPIAQKHVDALVSSGRIDSPTGVVIMAGFRTVMAGVNLLEQRYPEIRNDRDLLSAAVDGFTDGFLERFDVSPEDNAQRGVYADISVIDTSVVYKVARAAVENGLVK